MRWQGLTGDPRDDPGALAITQINEMTTGGDVSLLRYNVGPIITAQLDSINNGAAGERQGEFLAGPIDLNNDGRGDLLWANGGDGMVGYNPGGRGLVSFRIAPREDARSIKSIASVGNVLNSLIDSFAVNVQDARGSVVRFCHRMDQDDTPVDFAPLDCPDHRWLTLGLNSPATIAGR